MGSDDSVYFGGPYKGILFVIVASKPSLTYTPVYSLFLDQIRMPLVVYRCVLGNHSDLDVCPAYVARTHASTVFTGRHNNNNRPRMCMWSWRTF